MYTLEVNWISKRIVEVNANDQGSGLLNREEAIALAENLICVAAELLSIKGDSK